MKGWNHLPQDLPLGINPLFQKPLCIGAVLRWYIKSWFPISINLILVGLACLAYAFWSPRLHETDHLGFWVVEIWSRNLILTFLVAQSLHLIFHRHQLQGRSKKYDARVYPREGSVFTFKNQVYDNMFWTLASGVTIWSFYECLIWYAMGIGWVKSFQFADAPFWFVAWFFFIPIWESFYFYWIHRLLHWGPFYRCHALHHRNTDVGPWSGLSMHPIEHLFYFGTIFIHFILPTHPIHLVYHLMFYGIYAITTHTGFEGLWVSGRKRVHLGNFHHQMHHRYFEVNYGTLEIPWDHFFGTFHDGSEAAHEAMKKRLRAYQR